MGIPGKGAVIGLAAMAAFIPGMLGSRKTGGELRDIYSGNEPVPVRQGRWWELGSTPFEGGRIKAWRPHWSILHKSRSEEASLYGSEANKWAHNPVLHPIKWLRDPYYLEKLHYSDRPYPVASPAFSNVPLVGIRSRTPSNSFNGDKATQLAPFLTLGYGRDRAHVFSADSSNWKIRTYLANRDITPR
jgi:hypothetical protein